MKYPFINKRITAVFLAGMMMGSLLWGCGKESREEELSYRETGIAAMESGDYAGAVAAFDAALKRCNGSIGETEIDICCYKAAAQYAAGDAEAALATCKALLDYDEKNADVWYLYGCLLLAAEQPDDAKAAYGSAVENNPDDYELYIAAYENLCAYNLKEDGEAFLNKAFSVKGDTAADSAARGKIYYLLGQYDNAKKELQAAIEQGEASANLTMAQACEALGDLGAAETYYAAYVEQGAKDSVAMNSLAELAMAKGNYSGGLSYVEQGLAMEETPNRRELMQNQIICMEKTGDFTGAFRVISEYAELYPEDASAAREYIFLKNRQEIKELPSEAETGPDAPSTEAANPAEDGNGETGTP